MCGGKKTQPVGRRRAPFAEGGKGMSRTTASGKTLEQSGYLRTASDLSAEQVYDHTAQGLVTSQMLTDWSGIDFTESIFVVAHPMDFKVPPHVHDYYELCFILDGTVVNIIGGQKIYMLDGTLCAMNLASRHALEPVDEGAVVVNLCLRPALFESGIFAEFLAADNEMSRFLRGEGTTDHLMFSDSQARLLLTRMEAVVMEFARADFHQSFALCAQVLLLLDELSRTETYSYYGLSPKTLRMLAYLREHCADVTMRSLGREFGYTANYCSQYLRKHTGKTAGELIAEARVAKAEGLLAGTDLGVEAVAAAVGYKSYSHFNELFQLYRGMTPGDYRRLSRIA